MNNSPTLGMDRKVPKEMIPFVAKCPRLLPGETEKNYHALFDLMVEEIEPQTASEWLVLADIVGLFWEVGRYRTWKNAVLNIYRPDALEKALRVMHRSHDVVGEVPASIGLARRDAEVWRADPAKRQVLQVRLAEHGYDEEALNAAALLEALVPLTSIDRALCSARGQLNAMLKEIHVRREFVHRAEKALDERVQAAKQAFKAKQIEAN
jgi:hypothetical protein